jgi:DhnA family fructose-bisphosphate aldolase class Ia
MGKLRMGRIFGDDGLTVILALDHASFMGPMPGLEDPGAVLQAASSTGIDAVLTTFGIAKTFAASIGRMGLILRMDGGATMRSTNPGNLQRLFSVEDALRLGADAVACMGMIGYEEEAASLQVLSELTAQAEEWNMPVMAEMLVKSQGDGDLTAEDVGFAMRIGAELGADFIKTPYAPPIEQYRSAMQACYCPVVILGGAKTDDEADILEPVAEALEAGARGVAIGRNVWQHSDPQAMCCALISLVHGGATVAQALKEIRG